MGLLWETARHKSHFPTEGGMIEFHKVRHNGQEEEEAAQPPSNPSKQWQSWAR